MPWIGSPSLMSPGRARNLTTCRSPPSSPARRSAPRDQQDVVERVDLDAPRWPPTGNQSMQRDGDAAIRGDHADTSIRGMRVLLAPVVPPRAPRSTARDVYRGGAGVAPRGPPRGRPALGAADQRRRAVAALVPLRAAEARRRRAVMAPERLRRTGRAGGSRRCCATSRTGIVPSRSSSRARRIRTFATWVRKLVLPTSAKARWSCRRRGGEPPRHVSSSIGGGTRAR